jgi:hypothetical protein
MLVPALPIPQPLTSPRFSSHHQILILLRNTPVLLLHLQLRWYAQSGTGSHQTKKWVSKLLHQFVYSYLEPQDCIRPAKRIAAPSANREAFDQVHRCLPLFLHKYWFLSQLRAQANYAKAQAGQSKAQAKRVLTQSKAERQRLEEENLRVREEIQALKNQYEIHIATNDAAEEQMVDHILQNETERREMQTELTSLVLTWTSFSTQ